jgi:plastocyanin
MKLPAAAARWACTLLLCSGLTVAQRFTLTARVTLTGDSKAKSPTDARNIVLWLTPETDPVAPRPTERLRLVQKNKSFEPHLLVIPVGSVVAFPNHDPFFHNVFSLFEGKRFDLGLYEAGSTRDVRFDKPGISYIFCNIHPEMSAVVVVLDTPFYGVSDQRGQIMIPNVPPGRYTRRVWYEGALPETLKELTREVAISESSSTLGILHLPQPSLPQTHKNLYGLDYAPPSPDSPAYEHQ